MASSSEPPPGLLVLKPPHPYRTYNIVRVPHAKYYHVEELFLPNGSDARNVELLGSGQHGYWASDRSSAEDLACVFVTRRDATLSR